MRKCMVGAFRRTVTRRERNREGVARASKKEWKKTKKGEKGESAKEATNNASRELLLFVIMITIMLSTLCNYAHC